MKTVQVRPVRSTGTEAPGRNLPSKNGRALDKQTPYLIKLLMGLCIGQLITMTAAVAVLGSFVNSHGKDIDRLKEESDKIDRIEAKVDREVSTNKEQMTMIQQLATNLTKFEGEAMNPRGPSLGNTINKLEAIVETQNDSILENSAQLSQLQKDLSVVQNVIQTQVSVIEKLEGNYIAGNATANDHSLRIAILESEQTVNRYTFYNHTDKFELLEKNLNNQNSSVQRVSEKVLKLNSEHKFDRNLVKELKASVRLIEDNITTQAVILQNYSSYLNEFGHEMTLISEMIQLQHKDHEQLKENMTDHERNSFAFDERLYKLEARSNTSEIVLVDYHNRLGQVELKHISEIAVNEEQESQIRVLEDEMNQTWIAIQGFSERSADPIDGNWTDWTVWSSCSQTCGDGEMTRGRFCVNPRPADGGQYCVGAAEEQQMCNIGYCPVNGAWATWSSWSGCSRTCGPGLLNRQRTCTNPTPAGNGRSCTGNSIDAQQCETVTCPDFRSAFAIYGKTPSYNSSTSVVIFPDNAVKTNIGNDYDSTTGQFTCRYAGVYIFVVNLYRFNRDDNRLKCYIQKNGTKVVDANAPASSEYEWSGGSGSTVVHLDQGDTVNVGSCLGDNNFSMFTSFMGFLLQAD